MKTIPKQLVTVLPRIRANSVSSSRLYSSPSLSLFDSSAPSPSRPVLSSNRFYIESKPTEVESPQHPSYSQPPFSLALAQPHSSGQTLANSNPQGQYALFPYSSFPAYGQPHTQQTAQEDKYARPRSKHQRLKYQLDVGAYGIPKRCRAAPPPRRHRYHPAHQHHPVEDVCLSVQVGEDAYFVRDNAMGVADGVGGWSKIHSTQPSLTPSALFAKRLMHYCSAEVESWSQHSGESTMTESSTTYTSTLRQGSGSRPHPPTRPQFSFTHHLRPRPSSSASSTPAWNSFVSSSLPPSFTFHSVHNHTASSPPNNHSTFSCSSPSKEYPIAEREDGYFSMEQDLEDSLEELSEGIDILQILERAYDNALKAHVVPDLEPFNSQVSSTCPMRTDEVVSTVPLSESSTSTSATLSSLGSREPKLLLEGSSTALLAVLDHPPYASYVLPSTSTTTPAPVSSAIPTNPTFLSPSSSLSQTSKLFASSTYPFASPSSATTCNDALNNSLNSLKETKTAQTPLKESTATNSTSTTTAPSTSRSASMESASGADATVPESTAPGIECEVVEESGEQGDYDAVIKIAHVGDCMGMLVRGEEIVWRSEEMWWNVRSNILPYSKIIPIDYFFTVQYSSPTWTLNSVDCDTQKFSNGDYNSCQGG